jgi:phosphatidylglycerophosphate synthase
MFLDPLTLLILGKSRQEELLREPVLGPAGPRSGANRAGDPPHSAGGRLGTPANLLSAFRLALAPPLSFFCLSGAYAAAIAVLLLAMLSDVLDGRLAPAFRQTSLLGGGLHACAGFAICAAAFGALTARGLMAPLVLPAASACFALFLARTGPARRAARSRIGRFAGLACFLVALAELAFLASAPLHSGRLAILEVLDGALLGYLIVACAESLVLLCRRFQGGRAGPRSIPCQAAGRPLS